MDGAINFFNVEIGVFLRYLHYFSNIECVKIGEQTVELLQAIVNLIAELMNKAEIVKLSERTDVDFLIDLDEHRYELRRCILCRHCFTAIPMSRDELDAHNALHYAAIESEMGDSFLSNGTNSSTYSVADSKLANSNASFANLSSNNSENIVEAQSDSDNPYDITNRKFTDVVTKGEIELKSDICKSRESLISKKSLNISNHRQKPLIKVRGLPWTATKKEILDFFSSVKILNDLNGIHFITDDQNAEHGVAYIEFASKKYHDMALGYHNRKLGERYIEVTKATEQDHVILASNKSEDNILRLEGLPWNSKEEDVRKFFSGLHLKEVILKQDPLTHHTLEAFIRLSSVADFDTALKHNWHLMGIRHIKIFRSSEKQMKYRMSINQSVGLNQSQPDIQKSPPTQSNASKIAELKVSEAEWQQVESRRSKTEEKKKQSLDRTYMVVARGFHWKVTKMDVITFFKDIKIVDDEDGINIIKNGAMEAHVVLGSKADRKKALAQHNKLYESRTITVTELEPKVKANAVSPTTSSKIIQIRGLPWSVDKEYVAMLFPGMKINYETGIQIEMDENQRRTGYAYVQFEKLSEYEEAFRLDLTNINPYLKIFKATKEQFDHTVAGNKAHSYLENECNEFQKHFPLIRSAHYAKAKKNR